MFSNKDFPTVQIDLLEETNEGPPIAPDIQDEISATNEKSTLVVTPLPAAEAEIKADDEETPTTEKTSTGKAKQAPIKKLWQYADTADMMVLPIGILFAMGQGGAMPFFAVIFSDSMDASVGNTGGSYREAMENTLRLMGILAGSFMISGTIWQTVFNWSAERQSARMRVEYFKTILGRDISWFDNNNPAAIPSRLASEVQLVQDAIGGKAGMIVQCATQFVVGIVLALIKGWQLTLCILAMLPLFAVGGGYFAKNLAVLTSEQQDWFSKANGVAEEVLYAIRTVAAFGGEERELSRFKGHLGPAKSGGIRAGAHMGFSFGLVMALFAFGYAIAFYYGAHHMVGTGKINPDTGDPYNGSDVIMIFFSVLIGIMSLNDISAPLMAVGKARAAIQNVEATAAAKAVIEQESHRDKPLPREVEVIQSLELRNVRFAFPSKPNVEVLRGASLTIMKGQKVALVGESGSGKSTIIQLLERFYDPTAGDVLVNGVSLRTLPIGAWRQLIGYVGQEPVLFATSIMQNIKSGGKDVTNEQAIEAAKQAQAFDFVDALPEKFNTFVGIGGGQVSGGQKQRIAIARALARRPQLMLLDEATSALDNESEKLVQETLDRLQNSADANLTTIAIAHRLSTVRNSDVIFVIKKGFVVEQGNHNDLMTHRGEYFNLVRSQTAAVDEPVSPTSRKRVETNFTDSKQPEKDDKTKEEKVGEASTPNQKKPQLRLSEDEIQKERLKAIGNYKTPMGRLFRMSKPEWVFFPLAFLSALIAGANMPMQGYLFSQAMTGFYEPCDTLVYQPVWQCPDAMLDEMNKIILLFVLTGFVCWIGDFGKFFLFTYIQESLTKRLREQAFAALLRQEIGFFDDPANSPSGLTATLARQCLLVAAMTGINFGNACGSLLSVISGIVLGFLGSWKLALAILGLLPIIMVSLVVVMMMLLGTDGGNSNKFTVSSEIAAEVILNVRTVRALMAEENCLQDYTKVVMDIAVKEARSAPKKGLAFGFGNASIFSIYILGFGYGAILIDDGLEPGKMYQSLMCILFGAFGAAFAAAFSPNAQQGRLAAHDIFAVIDKPSKIDSFAPTGSHRSLGDGVIHFDNVEFIFPHRPELKVLRGVTFSVPKGATCALVGPSGSGKSTVIQLLQRFYDPNAGVVRVGGVPLTEFDVSWWRKQVGFVGQEPILFDMSLEGNVKYGRPDASREEVEAAAKKANMDYVLNGKVHWDDIVGMKGGRLSGGQKQRCAIARAILREPSILLLDEATSALDSASERVVQEALDKARQGRTTFTIAHRLSTIKDSDIILVVSMGTIVEKGTHDELMELQGLFWNLNGRGAH